MNNPKTKRDDLEAGELKTIATDLKKLSDLEIKKGVKNTKFNTLGTKVNRVEKKIPDLTYFTQVNQYKILKTKAETLHKIS